MAMVSYAPLFRDEPSLARADIQINPNKASNHCPYSHSHSFEGYVLDEHGLNICYRPDHY